MQMVAQQTRPQETSRVIVFSERHAMLAEINSGMRRLSDVVNDPLHKVFHLEQVRINLTDRMDETIATYNEIRIKRDSIRGVLVMTEPPRPPQQRISNFVPKQPVRVAALLPAFHVVGNIFLNGKIDPVDFVLNGNESFVVLSNASVTMNNRVDKPINVPTAFINRSHIELATIV